jgi:membrane fusion protein (multidrug efflux system)
VPRTAVTYSLYGDNVYVVKQVPAKEGQTGDQLVAERRFVKTGQTREDRVAILSGLATGEQVVTTGQLKLNPGAHIRVDNSKPLTPPATRPKE